MTQTQVQEAVCRHIEDIRDWVGTCRLCRQQVRYDPDGNGMATVIRRGEINGVTTMVRPPREHPRGPAPARAPAAQGPAPSSPKPATWGSMTAQEKGAWYDAHRADLEKDRREMGHKAFLKKWGLGDGTWRGILKRWARHDRATSAPESEGSQETPAVPPRPRKRHNLAMHRYYEENRAQILEDVRTLGRDAAGKKWGIPGSTLSTLLKRWLTRPRMAQESPFPPGPATDTAAEAPKDAVSDDLELVSFRSRTRNTGRTGIRVLYPL